MPTEEEIRKAAETLSAMAVPKRSEAEIQMLAQFNQEAIDAEMIHPDEEDAAWLGFDPHQDCGRWSNGRLTKSCSLAGTEQCDFECPYRSNLYK